MNYTMEECKGIERKIEEVIKNDKQRDFLDKLFYCTHKREQANKGNYDKFINNFLDDYNFFRKRAMNHSRTMFLSLHNAFLRYGTNLPSWKRLKV